MHEIDAAIILNISPERWLPEPIPPIRYDLAGMRLGIGDEFRDRFHRQRGSHLQHERVERDARDRVVSRMKLNLRLS